MALSPDQEARVRAARTDTGADIRSRFRAAGQDPDERTMVRLPDPRAPYGYSPKYATVGELAEYRDKEARRYAQNLPNTIMGYEYGTGRPITLEEMRQNQMQMQMPQQQLSSTFFNLAQQAAAPTNTTPTSAARSPAARTRSTSQDKTVKFFTDPKTYSGVPFGEAGAALLTRGALKTQAALEESAANVGQTQAQTAQTYAMLPFQQANLGSQTAQNYGQLAINSAMLPFQQANLGSQTARNYGELNINYAMMPFRKANLGVQMPRYFR